MMKTRLLIFTVACMFYMPIVYGACTNNISSTTLNYGTVVMQRDTPPGSVIGTMKYGIQQVVATCQDPSGVGVVNGIVSVLSTNGSNNGVAVFNTSLTGVGISMGINGGFYAGQWNDQMPAGRTTYAYGWSAGAGSMSWTFQPQIQFYKTAMTAQSGEFSQQIGYYQPSYGSTTFLQGRTSGPIPVYVTGNVVVVACSIRIPNLVFAMGDLPVSNFGTSVGTIPVNGQQTQNLGLDCDAGANINVTLSGTQNPDVSTTSVLALTGQNNAGVAKGVGVQIIYNGSPLILNNRIVLKQSSGGQESFPIIARYYQTKSTVSPGTANASATLNLTYQ